MTEIRLSQAATLSGTLRDHQRRLTPHLSRGAMALIVVGAVARSLALTDAPATSRAVSDAGIDLTRLLRFMAVIKGAMALGAVGALFWRLGSDVSLGRR